MGCRPSTESPGLHAARGQGLQGRREGRETSRRWHASATTFTQRNSSLTNLGILLSELDRREEALAPTQEAVEDYRGLADREAETAAAYLHDLAVSLLTVGWVCVLTRRDAEIGLAAVEESRELPQMEAMRCPEDGPLTP